MSKVNILSFRDSIQNHSSTRTSPPKQSSS